MAKQNKSKHVNYRVDAKTMESVVKLARLWKCSKSEAVRRSFRILKEIDDAGKIELATPRCPTCGILCAPGTDHCFNCGPRIDWNYLRPLSAESMRWLNNESTLKGQSNV